MRTRQARLTEMFSRYEQEMYRIAYGILRDAPRAEDAVMAAFERMLRADRVPEDPEGDDAGRFARLLARNAAIDLYRRVGRDASRSAPLDEARQVGDGKSPEPFPDAGFAAELEGLPPHYRAVLEETIGRERTSAEAAAALGIGEANVRKRKERALAQLRKNRGLA